MKQLFTAAALAALILPLAACGGGGGTLGGGAGRALNYTPVYRTAEGDLIEQAAALDEAMRGIPGHSTATGATGVMAMTTLLDATPSLANFKLWLSADRSKGYLSINGGPAIVLDATSSGLGGGNYNAYPNASGKSFSYLNFIDYGKLQYADNTNVLSSTNGYGHFGLETPPENLSGSATYDGDVDAFGYVSSFSATDLVAVNGTFSMEIDFDTGTVGGTTSGTLTLNSDNSAATGTVTGSFSGNGVSGTFTFAGGGNSADLTYAGKLYEWDASRVAGAVIGTFEKSGGGSQPMAGTFAGDLTP